MLWIVPLLIYLYTPSRYFIILWASPGHFLAKTVNSVDKLHAIKSQFPGEAHLISKNVSKHCGVVRTPRVEHAA